MSIITDMAQQIAIEAGSKDARTLINQAKNIEEKARGLQQDAERKLQQLQGVVAEREDFETDLARTLDSLREKESALKPREQLSLELDDVDGELQQLTTLKEEMVAEVQTMMEQIDEHSAKYDNLDENVPLEVKEKTEEFESLGEQIKVTATIRHRANTKLKFNF